MIEKQPHAPDAKLDYIMDPAETRATVFLNDPRKYMHGFIQEIRQSEKESSDVVVRAIDEISSLCSFVVDVSQVKNTHLLDFLFSEDVYQIQRGLFRLLRDAGIAKNELESWVNIESDEDDPEAKMHERAERVILNEIYD